MRAITQDVSFWRRLPADAGGMPICVSTSSYLSYLTQSLESIHGSLLAAVHDLLRPGDCFWDVGANLGVASFAAAHRVGPEGFVLSVEADGRLVSQLRRTLARNAARHRLNVEVLPAAASDRVGIARFNLSSFSSATNALVGFGRAEGVLSTVSIPSMTLDFLRSQVRPPDLVKIDVEGAELLVLKGAAELLGSHRPIVVIEVGAEVADDVSALFGSCGYALYEMASRRPTTSAVGDVIAIPSERSIESTLTR